MHPGRHSRKHTPPYLKRRLWQFIAVIALLSTIGPLTQYLARGRLPTWGYVVISAFPAALCGGLSGCYALWMSRHYRRARDAGARICWNCGYSLRGLDDTGRCPECGKYYTIGDLRERWLLCDWSPFETPVEGRTRPTATDD